MMNKTQITLIITGFIILALMATNPSIEDHREGVKKMYKDKLAELNKDKNDDLAAQIGTGIGMLIGDGFIDKIVSRDNYLLFSMTKVTLGDKTRNIGVGILGQVIVQDYENIQSNFDVNASENETLEKEDINENFFLGCWSNDYVTIEILPNEKLKIYRYDISKEIGGETPISNASYRIENNKIVFLKQRLYEENFYHIEFEAGESVLVEEFNDPKLRNKFTKTECLTK